MEGYGLAQFEHTHPYVFVHCEWTKNDENVNEPILERGMITLVD